MTRAQIIYITKWTKIEPLLYNSCEFNGDGYLQGYGTDYLRILNQAINPDDFKKSIENFNKKDSFQYNEPLVYQKKLNKWHITFDEDSYFDEWFSDYLYFYNGDNKNFSFTDINQQKITLKPKETAVFYFGKLYLKTYL